MGKLKLHETPSQGVWVAGLREVFVSSAEEALRVIEAGDKNRSVAATQMNAESSRSHSVFMLNIAQTMADGTVKLRSESPRPCHGLACPAGYPVIARTVVGSAQRGPSLLTVE